jgi:hypothetical protein
MKGKWACPSSGFTHDACVSNSSRGVSANGLLTGFSQRPLDSDKRKREHPQGGSQAAPRNR